MRGVRGEPGRELWRRPSTLTRTRLQDPLRSTLQKKHGPCQAVCESTGNLWHKTFESFKECNLSVILANSFKTRAVVETDVKTDTLDARTQANLLKGNPIAKCHVVNPTLRGQRQLLRRRAALVQKRTRFANHLRNRLDRHDVN